jgi:iron complex transport system substrate-binding protein
MAGTKTIAIVAIVIIAIIAIAAAVILMNGNGNNDKPDTPTEDTYDPVTFTTYVDYAGNKTSITFDKMPERVVAGCNTALNALLYFGLGDRIIGVYYMEEEVWDEVADEYEKVKKRIGDDHILSGNIAKDVLTSWEPDLVIGWVSWTDGEKKLGSNENYWNPLGCNVMSFNTMVSDSTVDGMKTDYTNLGNVFKIRDKTDKYINDLMKKVDSVAGALKDVDQTIAVYDGLGASDAKDIDNFWFYDTSTFVGYMLDYMGADLFYDSSGKMQKSVLYDRVDEINVMFFVCYGGATFDKTLAIWNSDDVLKTCPAIVNERYQAMKLSVAYGADPSIIDVVDYLLELFLGYEVIDMNEVEKNITSRLFVYGNATNDDTLDDKDILMLRNIADGYVAWDQEKYPWADADQDGKITKADADQVQKIINKEKTTLYYQAYDDTVAQIHYPNTGKIAVTLDYGMMMAQVFGIYDRIDYAVDRVITKSSEGRYPGVTGFTSVGTFSNADVASFTDTILSHKDITLVLGSLSKNLYDSLRASGQEVDHLLLSASAQQSGTLYDVVSEMLTASVALGCPEEGLEYVAYMDKMEKYIADNTVGMQEYTFVCAYNTSNATTTYVDTTGAAGGKFGDVWTLSHLPMKDLMPPNGSGCYEVDIEDILLDYDPDIIVISMWNVATDATSPADAQKIFEEKAKYFEKSRAYKNGMVFGINYETYGTCIGVSGLGLLASYIWPGQFDEATGWQLLQEAIDDFTLLKADVKDCGGLICYKLNQ